jgi:hypothetical protein
MCILSGILGKREFLGTLIDPLVQALCDDCEEVVMKKLCSQQEQNLPVSGLLVLGRHP